MSDQSGLQVDPLSLLCRYWWPVIALPPLSAVPQVSFTSVALELAGTAARSVGAPGQPGECVELFVSVAEKLLAREETVL